MGKFVVMLALGLATATVANADIVKRDFGNPRAHAAAVNTQTATPAMVATPEIDPAGMLSGLTLLLGGLAVVRGRRKA